MSSKAGGARPRRSRTLSWGLFDNSVGPLVLLLSRALTGRSLAALASYGLPPGSLSVLALIDANPHCSQTDLALATGMSKSGVVGLVDELERRGLALRAPFPGDRRRNSLTLTPGGVAQLREMAAVQVAQERPIEEELTAAELAQLIALLRRAYQAMDDDPAA